MDVPEPWQVLGGGGGEGKGGGGVQVRFSGTFPLAIYQTFDLVEGGGGMGFGLAGPRELAACGHGSPRRATHSLG